jgi:hypothetical protein
MSRAKFELFYFWSYKSVKNASVLSSFCFFTYQLFHAGFSDVLEAIDARFG